MKAVVDRVSTTGTVWLGLTVVVVVGYALVVAAVSNMLRRQAGLPESLLAAGVVAAR